MRKKRGYASLAAMSALALGLTACSGMPERDGKDPDASTNKGSINGSGASSQVNAQQAWRDNYSASSGFTINYDPTGSGTGREQFIAGKTAFAGTDSVLNPEEVAAATSRCNGTEPLELPLYISPIALAFNLDGITSLNLTADLIAHIFNGTITTWNDPKIAAINPGVKLPEIPIIPVNRADDSGTTKNFQKYLAEAAGKAWPHKPEETWPISGTQSAEKTSGVVNLVKSTPGAITYADAAQIAGLGSVAVQVNGKFLPYSPGAAAAIVDGSGLDDDATERRITFALKRDGSVADAYPIVMISYLVACTDYSQPGTAEAVKGYLTYVASAEGQEKAAAAKGGNAPISQQLRERVTTAINLISTN